MNTGYFRMLAHPDLMFIGNFAWDDHCSRATDLLLNAAAAHDWILEYNANGLRRGIQTFPDGNRPPYPHPRFWNEVAKTNIRVVVGADAHGPQQVWDETMQAAIAQVQKQGFNIAVPPERSMS
jgi:histidinol-phosphatase (PHP family)